MARKFDIHVSGCAFDGFPVDTAYALLWTDRENTISVPKQYPYKGNWGGCVSTVISGDDGYPMPIRLSILYLSLTERKFYAIDTALPAKEMGWYWLDNVDDEGHELFSHIVVGMAPFGGVALWFHGDKKSVLLAWLQAEEMKIGIEDFQPMLSGVTLEQYCRHYIEGESAARNEITDVMDSPGFFDKIMRQYAYRYVISFRHYDKDSDTWRRYGEDTDEPVVISLSEKLLDGTHNRLNDGYLMRYHEAGQPGMLSLCWNVKKAEYEAFFWFKPSVINGFFTRFYGNHPDTKSDFLVFIDPDKMAFAFALYRHGLNEPVFLPLQAFQMKTFRNGMEKSRSLNYSLPDGAWIW